MTPAPDLTISGHASIGDTPLFAPLTLTLGAGQWTCLLGGSGVGKTTVLRLIAGLETGADFTGQISASDGQTVPTRVAYMAQDDLLLPWATVAQNVSLGARLRVEKPDLDRRDRLIERMRLQDHMAKKPSELSGGQRQRVALARTLMEDRPIVLLMTQHGLTPCAPPAAPAPRRVDDLETLETQGALLKLLREAA